MQGLDHVGEVGEFRHSGNLGLGRRNRPVLKIISSVRCTNRIVEMVGDEKPESGMTNRRSVIVGSAAAVAGIGIGVAGAKVTESDSDTSTVSGSFTVVDRRGKQRFRLGTEKPPIILGGKTYPAAERGGPDGSYLIFNDENGDEKGGIIAASSGALVSLDYPNGDAIHLQTMWQDKMGGAALTMTHIGDPTTPLDEAKHPPGVQLYADTENGTGLNLCDTQGLPRIQLRVAMDGTPSIAILDENGVVVKQL
ncbi:hypothetical protein AB0M22_31485 [Nocardia sp. NPDC051756]|uniref:hypothetical protein n=1 Tax=Nocardia sp. NPDC051756 TaxID=3154751 RepID=UPI0034329091